MQIFYITFDLPVHFSVNKLLEFCLLSISVFKEASAEK